MEAANSQAPARRDEEHDRWLAMQSAYEEYKRASEALDCTSQSADDTNERSKLPVLEGQQWLAFERYFETRMEFLEARFDEGYRPAAATAPRPSAIRDIVCRLSCLILIMTGFLSSVACSARAAGVGQTTSASLRDRG